MEGKSIEDSKKKRRADKEAARGRPRGANDTTARTAANPSQKIRIPYKDANGQALILEVDASAITATTSASISTPSPFAGIASIRSDVMTGATNSLSTSTDLLELEGWMATYDIKDLPEARLPSIPITPDDFAFSTIAQGSIGFRMIDTIPFKIDSGASASISPIREDFVSYQPITPHGVRGLGGVVVKAIGIGNIIIHQPYNRTLILHNALHIPDAGVRLISISSLWRYSQQKVRFDGPTCSITADDMVMAMGTLHLKTGLYDLDVPTSNELSTGAYTVTASPTLETWHRRLGHTNYQCIQNMARMSMVSV
jgi:GAG-pre-integrase domain